MAVLGSLLHNCGANGVTLFEDLLGRGPLGNEVGNERLGAGFLLRLGEAVDEVCGDDATGGDVEAALFSGNHNVSNPISWHWRSVETGTLESSEVRIGGEEAYTEAFVHGLSVGVG